MYIEHHVYEKMCIKYLDLLRYEGGAPRYPWGFRILVSGGWGPCVGRGDGREPISAAGEGRWNKLRTMSLADEGCCS